MNEREQIEILTHGLREINEICNKTDRCTCGKMLSTPRIAVITRTTLEAAQDAAEPKPALVTEATA